MIRLQVMIDGAVTGDVGSICAYENQSYSEPIKILHPQFEGALYKLKYYWGNTEFTNLLDANDEVRIQIRHYGMIRLQFIAENPISGEVYLASKPFHLVVHKGVNNIYSCNNNFHSYYPQCSCNSSSSCGSELDTIVRLGIELDNEMRVRAEQDSVIWKAIQEIREALEKANIVVGNNTPEKLDANIILTSGEYNASSESINFPTSGQSYKLLVNTISNIVQQTAYAAVTNETRMYYRTGTIVEKNEENIENSKVVWTNWIPISHETNVMEIE